VPKRGRLLRLTPKLGRWYVPPDASMPTLSCHLERLHICHRCTPFQPVLVFKTPLHPYIISAGRFSASVSKVVSRIAFTVCPVSLAISRWFLSLSVFNQLRLMTTSSSVTPFSPHPQPHTASLLMLSLRRKANHRTDLRLLTTEVQLQRT